MNENNLPTLEELQERLRGKTTEEIINLLGKPFSAPTELKFIYKNMICELYSDRKQPITIIFDEQGKVIEVKKLI